MASRPLDADDIFLSYSREDGETYLNGLADALTKLGFACFDDRSGTDAGRLPPKTLFRKIRQCQTLVLLATPAAIRDSEFIAQEVREFARANGTTRIVGISFDAANATLDNWSRARWIEWVDGKSRSRERLDALERGVPSVGVVSRIEKQSDYQKSKDRLLRLRNRAIAVVTILVALAIAAGAYALYSVRQAAEATKQTLTAQAESKRQQTIAEAGALAAQSEIILRQRPEDVQRSLELARRALDLSSSVGFHSAETDSAIRQSLAVFPYLRESYSIAKGEEAVAAVRDVALSPDGRHFVVLDANGKLQIHDAGTNATMRALECSCSAVALSVGPSFAAAVTDRGVDVLSLGSGRSKRVTTGVKDVAGIAISPGGRYLAVVGEMRGQEARHQVLSVVDVLRGTVVKRFTAGTRLAGPDALPTQIQNVAFGPTGDLAVGGTSDDTNKQPSGGLMVVWHLRLDPKGLSAEGSFRERNLTAEDFARSEAIRQTGRVGAVAPGGDETYLATSEGVWKRRRGERQFSAVARPSYTLEQPMTAAVTRMAFTPDGRSVVLVKDIEGTQNDQSNDEIVLQKWDAAGYREAITTVPRTGTVALSAKPGGEAIAVVSHALGAGESAPVFGVREGARVPPLVFPSESTLADVKATALSTTADVLIHANDRVALLWDIWAGKTRTIDLAGAVPDVSVATVSPGGQFLAIYGKNSEGKRAIAVYAIQGGAGLRPKIVLQNTVHEMSSPANASDDDQEDFKLQDMFLSSDGRRLAATYSYAENFVRVWNVTDGTDDTPHCLQGLVTTRHESGCRVSDTERVALSHNGSLLAVSDDGTTQLFDLSKDRAAPPVTVLTRVPAASLAFSPDGRYFGVGSWDGLLYVLHTRFAWAQAARLAHDGAVRAVTFTGDGNHVATVSDVLDPSDRSNRSLRIWLLRSDGLLAEANSRLGALGKAGGRVGR